MNAIEVRNLSKSFKVQRDGTHSLKELFVIRGKGKKKKHEVLNNINLDIKRGETVGLIGTNGSGKSTLLKLMTGIYYPNEGTVRTNGKLTSLLELGAGFHPDFTGRENIYFNAAIFGLTKNEINDRVDEIINFSELGEAIDEPIRTYSSGMYMRLAFSVAINVDADILLIDEILAVGDQHFQEKCYKKIKEMRDDGNKTIVLVSHSLDVVKELCNRVIWIYKGQLKMDGNPAEVINSYLNQIAVDNQEKKKKAIESGEIIYDGKMMIETPISYTHFSYEKAKEVVVVGWKVTNADDAHFVVLANGVVISDVHNINRPDVVETFNEEYCGILDSYSIGFSVQLDLTKFMDRQGNVDVTCKLIRKNEINPIVERNIILIVDKE